MPTLFTIGTSRKTLQQFVRLLREAEVDAVIDTRLRNSSQLMGFAKKGDLEFLLTELCRIGYQHRPELAPSAPLLGAFQRGRDWDLYRAGFLDEMQANGMSEVLVPLLDQYERPCLLCACVDPTLCHRGLLAETAAATRPGLEVRHLR